MRGDMDEERRIDLRPWQNLDQLKKAYDKYVSPEEIDRIVSRIMKSDRFKERAGLTEEENRECFLNLVDSIVMVVFEELFYKKDL